MYVFPRWLALLAFLAVLGPAVQAQAVDSTVASTSQTKSPKLDIDAATLPSSGRTPKLNSQTIKPNESLLSGLDLGGSTLNFEGDRNPPQSRVGAETFEPGTLVHSQKSRRVGPSFFGLSIKKPLE